MTALSVFLILIAIPAAVGYMFYKEWHFRSGSHGRLEPGDFLIYRKDKVSLHPGARARNVWAAENGDQYFYQVDKFWKVSDVLEDGRLVAVTRTGKRHCLDAEDSNMRKPGLIERIRYRSKFPELE